MTQTKLGAAKAVATIQAKYGKDYYAKLGAKGGAAGTGHAFGHGKVDPRVAGLKGGAISKRGPAKYKWVEDKPNATDEAMFVDSNIDFGEGFFQKTTRQKVLGWLKIT